jgi:hypothetical protein
MIVARKRGFAGLPQSRSRKFFVAYQGRVLHGPGSELEETTDANYFRWPEAGDEYLLTATSPARDDGKYMEWNCLIPFLKGSIIKMRTIFSRSLSKGSH